MKVTLETAPKVPIQIDGRIMFSSEKAELIHLTLKRGEVIEKHDNPFDVIFYILEGIGKLTLNNETHLLNTNDCISVSTGIQRTMENSGDKELKILVCKLKQ